MKTDFTYKDSQEKILSDRIIEQSFVTHEQLEAIKPLYHSDVPYHNFLHVLTVAHGVLKLPKNSYTQKERDSLLIAALFHDADHRGGRAQTLDEFRSLDLAFSEVQKFEETYNLDLDYSIIRNAIIGTVFKNRASNTNPYAIILADLDVGAFGMEFAEFLYYADFPFSLENSMEIIPWMEQNHRVFQFLTGIEKHIFRDPEIREIYPHVFENIKLYLTANRKNIQTLYDIWKTQDITVQDFREKYREIFV